MNDDVAQECNQDYVFASIVRSPNASMDLMSLLASAKASAKGLLLYVDGLSRQSLTETNMARARAAVQLWSLIAFAILIFTVLVSVL